MLVLGLLVTANSVGGRLRLSENQTVIVAPIRCTLMRHKGTGCRHLTTFIAHICAWVIPIS